MSAAAISFGSTDGLALEGVLEGPDLPRACLVLCHPHPQMGGTMEAPLLKALAQHLVGEGWAVLRFNFRGIGASQGRSSTGEAEVQDARGALLWARARFPERSVAIGGWSFGGAVAIRTALADPTIATCVAIAPAVRARPGVTAGLPPAPVGGVPVPTLLVAGANDEQIAPEEVSGWAKQAGARFVEVAGANHFFWARYEKLADVVAGFLAENVP
ncbi:MAG: alpha/beta fold hydrolase [Actinomycetota bacterium]|nr:alpha/beta fold hydrolase [Actinomycetota bacterium]